MTNKNEKDLKPLNPHRFNLSSKGSAVLTQCREKLDKYIAAVPIEEQDEDWFTHWKKEFILLTKKFVDDDYVIIEKEQHKKIIKYKKWIKWSTIFGTFVGTILLEYKVGIIKLICKLFSE